MTAPPAAAQGRIVSPAASLPAAETEEPADEAEVVELSPFEVQSSNDDVGYYFSSTLPGTHMNSKLRDIANSSRTPPRWTLTSTFGL